MEAKILDKGKEKVWWPRAELKDIMVLGVLFVIDTYNWEESFQTLTSKIDTLYVVGKQGMSA